MTSSNQESSLEFSIMREGDVQRAVIFTIRSRLLEAFNFYERHTIGILISELSTNIIKYAGNGIIRVQPLQEHGKSGISIEAIDRGPGIPNLEAAFQDGFSTGGSLGLGLSAIKRLSDSLDIRYPLEGGMHIKATCWCENSKSRMSRVNEAVKSDSHITQSRLPRVSTMPANILLNFKTESFFSSYKGNDFCGDITWSLEAEEYLLLVHIDGSGHGYHAFQAASTILEKIQEIVRKWPPRPQIEMLTTLLKEAHQAATGTVGGALSIALIDRVSQMLHYVGIGNVTMLVFSPGGWEGVARGGIVGQRLTLPRVDSTKLRAGETVVSFSDGFSSSAIHKLRKHAVEKSDSQTIMHLMMGAVKDIDDASCLVVTCY